MATTSTNINTANICFLPKLVALSEKSSETTTIGKKANLIARIKNALAWAWSRLKELPFLIKNPSILIDKFYRWRVRGVMETIPPKSVIITLSHILPSHPLEGNGAAQKKNEARIEILKKNKNQFDQILKEKSPVISQQFIEGMMDSTSPMQLAYDSLENRCIAFDGNSRLMAIQRFFAEAYPGIDPKVKVSACEIDPKLLARVIKVSG